MTFLIVCDVLGEENNGTTIAKADEKIVREALLGVDRVHTMLPFSSGMKIVQIAKEIILGQRTSLCTGCLHDKNGGYDVGGYQ